MHYFIIGRSLVKANVKKARNGGPRKKEAARRGRRERPTSCLSSPCEVPCVLPSRGQAHVGERFS